ncbi:hypothetical protein [Priestia taiwanensis]|uniref:Uncharacterized protein n=1 Tax=Priestia taiwanensis TaxID=1347902 RepID=A0A917ER54_9BACI|nr:hypothetical protein [Priestia taiwanensis]MBM7363762.1 putative neutral ceramidase superfamily lipid hydrolase [Priestia taiwanensis]GGE74360.1 hypothetical protein GCM10007140_25240 [Priestia taiwanensis]
MGKNRKETIINEILFWKENNLLPPTYCDYLLAFYTEGSLDEIPVKKSRNKRLIGLIVLAMCLPIISILATYFTELSFDLQMLLTGIFVIISFLLVYFVLKIDKMYIHLPLIMTSVLLFMFSVQVVERIFGENTLLLTCTIVLNCFIWAGLGYYLRLKYFFISSVIGLLIVGVFWIM